MLSLIFLASCSNGDPSRPGVASGGSSKTIVINGSSVEVRCFTREKERRAALKTPLPPEDGKGHLFLFPTAAYRHLSSTTCPVSLTALFIAPNGVAADIQDLPSRINTGITSDTGITSEVEAVAILLLRPDHARSLNLTKGTSILTENFIRDAAPEPLPTVTIGGHKIFVELAPTEDERSRGLMHRPRMSRDHGMLFLYTTDATRSFYMRNTLIPLSIAYIRDARTIVDILDMKPLDETSILSTAPARFALETNLGWFKEHGIAPGSRVEFSPEIERLIDE